MAYFAKLGTGDSVTRVTCVKDDIATTEQAGIDFLHNFYKTNDVWKQTSYSTSKGVHRLGGTPFRKNYAAIGYTYDEGRDAFIPPKPFNSWTLNETTCNWEAPVAYPEGETFNEYNWDEETTNWVENILPQ